MIFSWVRKKSLLKFKLGHMFCLIVKGASTLSKTTFSIMTISIMTFSIMTLSVRTFNVMTLTIMPFSKTINKK